MAYTISLAGSAERASEFVAILKLTIASGGAFQIGDIEGPEPSWKWIGGKRAAARGVLPRHEVRLRYVRKVKKEPYCGQHPGPCVVNPFIGPRKKPKCRFLEWGDWVAFHAVVNGLLDAVGIFAEVWSCPAEGRMHGQTSKRFWIRKENVPRIRYEWDEEYVGDRPIPNRLFDWEGEGQFLVRDEAIANIFG